MVDRFPSPGEGKFIYHPRGRRRGEEGEGAVVVDKFPFLKRAAFTRMPPPKAPGSACMHLRFGAPRRGQRVIPSLKQLRCSI